MEQRGGEVLSEKMFILQHSSSISKVLLLLNSCSHSSSLKISSTNTTTTKTTTKTHHPHLSYNNNNNNNSVIGSKWMRRASWVVESAAATDDNDNDNLLESGAEVVRKFYERINAHDVDSVHNLISDNCVYEDLVFPRPFLGRQEILEFFKKFTNSTSIDLQFVIDDLSTEDSSSVGVIWHLEWKGKPFPFSKGCSYYRLEVINGKRQITYGRDSVEPAIKPGDAALAAIRSVTWLLQRFPQLADRL